MPLLYDYYKLVEKDSSLVSGIWKGSHIMLFFLTFVFGSLCTFCFHMLMYMFDDNCVLFPKMMRLSTVRDKHIAYEFIPLDLAEQDNNPPVDFITTQWAEASVCYIPIYVPLLSAIFGLIWTTMFLICSSSGRTLTGLLRPWRILPPAFVFCVFMSGLCFYASYITESGIADMCEKLSVITGNPRCGFAINVASLAYEKRIRGIYQATRLTLAAAWLHTLCWILGALLIVLRVVLVVDFQLVHIKVVLHGDVENVLEKFEKQVGVVTPDSSRRPSRKNSMKSDLVATTDDMEIGKKKSTTRVQFRNRSFMNSVSDFSMDYFRTDTEKSRSEQQLIKRSFSMKRRHCSSLKDLISPKLGFDLKDHKSCISLNSDTIEFDRHPKVNLPVGEIKDKSIEFRAEEASTSNTSAANELTGKEFINAMVNTGQKPPKLEEIFKHVSRDSPKKGSTPVALSRGLHLKDRLGRLLSDDSLASLLPKMGRKSSLKKGNSNKKEEEKRE